LILILSSFSSGLHRHKRSLKDMQNAIWFTKWQSTLNLENQSNSSFNHLQMANKTGNSQNNTFVHISRTHFLRTHFLRTHFRTHVCTHFRTHTHTHTHTFYRLQTFRLWTLHIKFDRRPDGLAILSVDMGECNLSYWFKLLILVKKHSLSWNALRNMK